MKGINVVKIHLSAPYCHFRVIDTNNPQRTYPLPPYSTIIGLLTNILGQRNIIQSMLKDDFSLGIVSKYNSISIDYTWLRNLKKTFHTSRFLLPENRSYHETREHIGGQMPINIEVLNDVEIYIYLSHPNVTVIDTILENASYPERWYSHIHLGRSEDWACIEDIGYQSLTISNKPKDFSNVSKYYQWMPRPDVAFGVDEYLSLEEYESLYNKVQGNITLVTSIYKLAKAPYTEGQGRFIRNFDHIPARITNSPVPFLDNFTLPNLFVDQELQVPVYMSKICTGGGEN